jgi:hypothetical protein
MGPFGVGGIEEAEVCLVSASHVVDQQIDAAQLRERAVDEGGNSCRRSPSPTSSTEPM